MPKSPGRTRQSEGSQRRAGRATRTNSAESRRTSRASKIYALKASGRGALERPRPDTGERTSHAATTYREDLVPMHEVRIEPSQSERKDEQLAALRALLASVIR